MVVLHMDVNDLFIACIPNMITSVFLLFMLAMFGGLRKRLGVPEINMEAMASNFPTKRKPSAVLSLHV